MNSNSCVADEVRPGRRSSLVKPDKAGAAVPECLCSTTSPLTLSG